jgi:hypothetical protein
LVFFADSNPAEALTESEKLNLRNAEKVAEILQKDRDLISADEVSFLSENLENDKVSGDEKNKIQEIAENPIFKEKLGKLIREENSNSEKGELAKVSPDFILQTFPGGKNAETRKKFFEKLNNSFFNEVIEFFGREKLRAQVSKFLVAQEKVISKPEKIQLSEIERKLSEGDRVDKLEAARFEIVDAETLPTEIFKITENQKSADEKKADALQLIREKFTPEIADKLEKDLQKQKTEAEKNELLISTVQTEFAKKREEILRSFSAEKLASEVENSFGEKIEKTDSPETEKQKIEKSFVAQIFRAAGVLDDQKVQNLQNQNRSIWAKVELLKNSLGKNSLEFRRNYLTQISEPGKFENDLTEDDFGNADKILRGAESFQREKNNLTRRVDKFNSALFAFRGKNLTEISAANSLENLPPEVRTELQNLCANEAVELTSAFFEKVKTGAISRREILKSSSAPQILANKFGIRNDLAIELCARDVDSNICQEVNLPTETGFLKKCGAQNPGEFSQNIFQIESPHGVELDFAASIFDELSNLESYALKDLTAMDAAEAAEQFKIAKKRTDTLAVADQQIIAAQKEKIDALQKILARSDLPPGLHTQIGEKLTAEEKTLQKLQTETLPGSQDYLGLWKD